MTSDAMGARLKTLARPTAPPDLSRAVMARIARVDDAQPAPEPRRAAAHWPAFGTVAGATLVMIAIVEVISQTAVTGAISPRTLGRGGLELTTGEWPLTLVAGLLLYLMGLFAPVRRGTARRRDA